MIAAYILYAHATSQVPVLCGQCNHLNLRYSWRYSKPPRQEISQILHHSYLVIEGLTTPLSKLGLSSHLVCCNRPALPAPLVFWTSARNDTPTVERESERDRRFAMAQHCCSLTADYCGHFTAVPMRNEKESCRPTGISKKTENVKGSFG